jgi:hypothetical protein
MVSNTYCLVCLFCVSSSCCQFLILIRLPFSTLHMSPVINLYYDIDCLIYPSIAWSSVLIKYNLVLALAFAAASRVQPFGNLQRPGAKPCSIGDRLVWVVRYSNFLTHWATHSNRDQLCPLWGLRLCWWCLYYSRSTWIR